MPDAGEVHVDVLPDLRKFGPKLKAELKRHAARGLDVPLGLDTDKADVELAALKARVSGTSASIRVSADTKAALARITGVEKAVRRLDGQTATVTVRTRQQGGMPAAPAPARQARPTTGGGGGGGGGQRPFTDVSPAASAAISTIGPAAIPAVGALTGAVAGLTSGLGAATTAAGAFAVGAVPAILDVADAVKLQTAAAEGGEEATKAYEEALEDLTPAARDTVDAWGDLTSAYAEWQRGLQGDTLPVVTKGIELLQSQLPSLTPIVRGAARGFDGLLDSSEAALAGPHWQRFTDFAARQAEPSIGVLGRSVGNLAVGFTGLLVSFEPLWARMGPGMEDLTAKFAAWSNEGTNFIGFIDWTIQNGPIFMATFSAIAGAAVDVGVALAPLGTVYAQGLGILAEAISAVAEQAPWLIQVAVAAKTAHVAFSLLGRVNQGLVQPLSQLPGHVREYASSLRGVETSAGGAARASSGLRGAVSGLTGVLGGPWGIALTAATAALGYWIAKKHEAEQAAKAYADAIREDSGALGENTRQLLAQELAQSGVISNARELGISTQDVTNALLGEEEAQRRVTAQLEQYLGEGTSAGAGRSGKAAQAKAQQADTARELKTALDAESGALAEGTQKARDAEAAAAALSTQKSSLGTATATATLQVDSLKQSLDRLTGSNISATQAEISYKAAVDRATAAVDQNGASTDLNTEAGRKNRQVLLDLARSANDHTAALRENGASADEVTKKTKEQRKEFIKAAKQMGYTKDEAEELADEYLGIPKDVKTAVEVSARGSWSLIEGYEDKTRGRGSGYLGGLATGGPVSGPGTPTSDSILARLSDGEWVQPAAAVDYYGPGLMEGLRTRSIPREAFAGMPGFAKGGYVRSTGNSSRTSPWEALSDHTGTIKPEYSRLVNALVDSVGTRMAEDFAEQVGKGPGAVVSLANASIGAFPEFLGNNVNAITNWYGMNGAPWCFPAGTLVRTPEGYLPIEQVHPGTVVTTPSGGRARTSALLRRRKPVLELKAFGVAPMSPTADHPYWARKGKHGRPQWVKAGELERGDMVAVPLTEPAGEALDTDLAYLLGVYAADGHRLHRDGGVQVSDADGDVERVVTAFKAAGFDRPRVTRGRTCAQVTVYDRAAYEACAPVGDLAHRKRVPGVVLEAGRAAREAFLEGYLAGDGNLNPRGVWQCTTVSRELAVSLAELLRSLGHVPSVRAVREAGEMVIEGRTVATRRVWVVEFKPDASRSRASWYVEDRVLWVPVRSVTETGRVEDVYDLTVPGEHAFIADGVHVSNCAMFISWLFAQTGNSRALGRASRTAWTGDYYTSGMPRTSNPQPGDVAVYGTRHVNLIASPGGGRRIGGNQSNNVTDAPYSGGAIFRPMWGRAAGFAEGGQVDVRKVLSQDRAEDNRFGPSPEVTALRQLAGLASGGLADGWAVVGEDGPELARFDDPARIYSSQESARVLSEARRASTSGGDGASAGPLVGEYHQHLHDSQATVREAMGELTHTLRTVRRGGLYGG